MPQLCSICSSPQKLQIEIALTAGESNRRIASQFGMSEAAVRRHRSHTQSDQSAAPASTPAAEPPAPTLPSALSPLEQRCQALLDALRALESCDAESIEQHYQATILPLRQLVAEMIDGSLERCRQREEPRVSDFNRASFRSKFGGKLQAEWRRILAERISQ